MVYLDGKLVQADGIWIDESGQPDERFDVLNYGWGAETVKDQQPDWFREKFANGYEA